MALHYRTGQEVRAGDYVLWHGDPGVVDFVPGEGIVITPPTVPVTDTSGDDIDFVARAVAAGPVFSLMAATDYDAVIQLLVTVPGVVLRGADSREGLNRYLHRNPGLSLIARVQDRMVGCILCGHDGRRGYLHHLAVAPAARRQGTARLLVAHCLGGLKKKGIEKVHIDVLTVNEEAKKFWQAIGWQRRDEIMRYSFTNSGDSNT